MLSKSILTLPIGLLTFGNLAAEVSFNFEIRPILSKNCIGCHGPDPEDRKADLRLDTFEGATAEVQGYAAIVPHHPEKSTLIERVRTDDPDDVMPPPEHGHTLSESQIVLLETWIKEGAQYETHWSFAPIAEHTPPAVEKQGWAENPIDAFILKGLESADLSPTEPADAVEMIRRLSLDLIGLPPSLDEVEAFKLAYEKNPRQAVSEAADRLLASPNYGEHWASMWLDMARYADTVGYSGDEHRDIWPWRDWVIEAFNDNKPYDEFIIEQVAGDLLPEATEQQRLATAFHRLTMNNNEGGTNDEEFRTIAVKDRLSTTINTAMGLTVRCAECHTHKYDPISHEEYYQLYAFFNQTADADRRDDNPRMDVMPKADESKLAEIHARISQLEERAVSESPWFLLPLDEVHATEEVLLEKESDGSVIAKGPNADYPTYTLAAPTPVEPVTAIRLELLPDRRHNDNVGRSPSGAMVMSQVRLVEISPDGTRTVRKFASAAADHSQPNYGVENLIGDEPHENGWAVKHDKEGFRAKRTAVFELAEPLTAPQGSRLEVKLVFKSQWPRMTAGRVRLATTSVENPVEKFKNNTLEPITVEIAELKKQQTKPVRVPIAQDLPPDKQRETRMMTRGSFMQPGEKVSPALPVAFGSLPEGAPRNRLSLAQWLVNDDNPLTARVAANRYWARFFGIGIVETEEDFGTQGTLPSHPELLDWLASEYRDSGWDTKKFLKLLVTSEAYRQSSVTTPERLEKDPRNILVSRGPRFRLSAEVVRDQALAASGLLTNKLYGEPVYPPSPIKTFTNAFSGSTVWVESTGPDRYRRAIYTYLKRSNPHPLFETFDMATRDVCVLRRFRTNTPLQSFMTLNDPVFVEASQALARIMDGHSPDLREKIRQGYLRVLLQEPGEEQLDAFEDLYQETLLDYQDSPQEALKLAGNTPTPAILDNAAELASLTVVANVMLNLDAFLCK
ncbi:PSD1 and planctomycete cytochrome C domain-containing protein [Roseibacillus persicicus]|uniref:Cytochrome c n=1 Tax=Roseibacillus persicicus TaxID=454148 RepID=A0A918WQ42_9BACT|nr:PSD1 and planctomycete cytochrome C domain-containing protein [Roseibacillus persicicus]GHC66991.1 cytochrome c [Roseibacillus persicicus]